MTQNGMKFAPGTVEEWMDCGNKTVTVETNARVLALTAQENLVDSTASITDSVVIPPCYIGPGACVERSVIGPHVSIGTDTHIQDSRIENSLIQNESHIRQSVLSNVMIGNKAEVTGRPVEASLGDFSALHA
jgi:glucose-1-phosphate thymidylyltransferase